MAQEVNLRKDEYLAIEEKLGKMHTDHLEIVSSLIAEMKMMVTSQDIFWVEKTSVKIVDMLETISYEIMPLLEQAFRDSEVGISKMAEGIMEIDH